MSDFGGSKQCCAGVLAGSDAGAAADTGSCVKSRFSDVVANRKTVGLRGFARAGRDVTSGLNNAVKRAAIHFQITFYREGGRSKRFDKYRIAIVKSPHMQLACR